MKNLQKIPRNILKINWWLLFFEKCGQNYLISLMTWPTCIQVHDCIDLARLIGIFNNLTNFLQLWFFVKSILADFRRSKTAVLTILEAFWFALWRYFTLESVKSFQKFKLQSSSNGQNGSLGLQNDKIDFT